MRSATARTHEREEHARHDHGGGRSTSTARASPAFISRWRCIRARGKQRRLAAGAREADRPRLRRQPLCLDSGGRCRATVLHVHHHGHSTSDSTGRCSLRADVRHPIPAAAEVYLFLEGASAWGCVLVRGVRCVLVCVGTRRGVCTCVLGVCWGCAEGVLGVLVSVEGAVCTSARRGAAGACACTGTHVRLLHKAKSRPNLARPWWGSRRYLACTPCTPVRGHRISGPIL